MGVEAWLHACAMASKACMHECVCMQHAHAHVRVQAHVRMCVSACVPAHARLCMCVCASVRVCMHASACPPMHTDARTCVYMDACMQHACEGEIVSWILWILKLLVSDKMLQRREVGDARLVELARLHRSLVDNHLTNTKYNT